MNKKSIIYKYSRSLLILGPAAMALAIFFISMGIMTLLPAAIQNPVNIAIGIGSFFGIIGYIGIAFWELRNS